MARTTTGFTSRQKEGLRRDTSAVLVFDASGQVSDTVGRYPGREEWVLRSEGSVTLTERPFGKTLVAVTHRSLIIIGTTDDPEVSYRQADGHPAARRALGCGRSSRDRGRR